MPDLRIRNSPHTLEQLHLRACNHPMPRWTPAMQAIMPDRREFCSHLSKVGALHRAYLAALVSILKPIRPLELGTGTGVSCAFMMDALQQHATLTTIEIRELDYSPGSPWRFDHLSPWKHDPRLVSIRGDVLDYEVHEHISGVDFLYIDTDHTLEQLSREWDIYVPKVMPGGIVILDDIHLNAGMEQFWNGIREQKHDTGRVIHESGFGLVVV